MPIQCINNDSVLRWFIFSTIVIYLYFIFHIKTNFFINRYLIWNTPCEQSTSQIFLIMGYSLCELSTIWVLYISQIIYHNNSFSILYVRTGSVPKFGSIPTNSFFSLFSSSIFSPLSVSYVCLMNILERISCVFLFRRNLVRPRAS